MSKILGPYTKNYLAFSHLKQFRNSAKLFAIRYYGFRDIKEILNEQVPMERQRMIEFRERYGKKSLGEIKLTNVMGGMRGLFLMWCDTSFVDPIKGILYRDILLKDVCEHLPRHGDGSEGKPEGVFWLLLTGKMPTQMESDWLTCEWNHRGKVPAFALRALDSLDTSIHPMAQLCAVFSILHQDSLFTKAYQRGVPRSTYWEYVYEDAMNLCAYLPTVVAAIYTNCYRGGKGTRELNDKLDWVGNFVNMLGFNSNPDFADFIRLYMVLHADHEAGNVSAHASHLVGSSLASTYLSYAAGLAGLAGPLHGMANQEVISWLFGLKKAIGTRPTDDELKNFIKATLSKGIVVPGYGHAVLRVVDPRFTIQSNFAQLHCPRDENVVLVTRLSKIIPEILSGLGKVANPNPNVDAHSGVLLQYYGLVEHNYYTALFGMSRAIGCLAQMIWSRALGMPIERPKSFTTQYLCKFLKMQESKESNTKVAETSEAEIEKKNKI